MEPAKLEKKISQEIKAEFGFDVPVIVLSVDQLKTTISKNPLAKDKAVDPAFLHVTFLAAPLKAYDLSAVEAKLLDGERISIGNQAVYLYCPNGYGKSRLTNSVIEAKLKVTATTRNWKTTNELLKLAQNLI